MDFMLQNYFWKLQQAHGKILLQNSTSIMNKKENKAKSSIMNQQDFVVY